MNTCAVHGACAVKTRPRREEVPHDDEHHVGPYPRQPGDDEHDAEALPHPQPDGGRVSASGVTSVGHQPTAPSLIGAPGA